jgi:iduronate 2-sulfatase
MADGWPHLVILLVEICVNLVNQRIAEYVTDELYLRLVGHTFEITRLRNHRSELENRTPRRKQDRIMRIDREVRSWVAVFVFVASSPPADAFESSPKPDVLLIVVDDLRPMLGCYGDARIRTPNIDRLARLGVVFERAYCQYAKCGTSRLSLMTGLRPNSIGVFSNRDKDVGDFRKRRPDAASMSRWLNNHGYHAQSFGKIDHDGWHVDDEWSVPACPGRPGEMLEVVDAEDVSKPTTIAERFACPVMQSPDVADDHLFAGRMTRQVIDVMRRRDSKQPTFLAVGYRRPHLPFVAPKRYFDMYRPDESWLAKNPNPPERSPVMAWFNSDGYVGAAKRVNFKMPNPPSREQAVEWNGYEMRSYQGVPYHGPIDTAIQLKLLQAYAACVSYVDAQIGKLLDELEATGKLNSTLIVFCSDHGWHLGEQSAWGKMTNFEIATRVPLIIAGPGIKAGRTKSIAELVDLYPTVCELSGVASPDHLEGESLASTLRNPEASDGGFALSQYARYCGKYTGRALRTDRYRFVVWEAKKDGKVVHRELYDHRTDPHETRNVAGVPEFAADVARLEKQLRFEFRREREN